MEQAGREGGGGVKWFIVLLEHPAPGLDLSKARQNPVGQWVTFDGPSNMRTVKDAAERLAPHCQRVSVFRGKNIGRMVLDYVDGVKQ